MLELPFLPGLGRPERDNAIDAYLGDTPEDVLDDGAWQQVFTHRPDPLHPGGEEGLSGRHYRRGPGQRRVLPLRR